MNDLLFLIPLLPLLAAVVNFVLGRNMPDRATSLIATIAVGASFALSLAVFANQLDSEDPLRQHLYTWIPGGMFDVPLNLYVDHLTAIMLLVVTTVSLLVHIYSMGYMKGDPGFYRFFAFLPLFVFSMLMLVLADNLAGDVLRLGSGWPVFLPADRFLLQTPFGQPGREEGVHRQPDRRLRIRDRHHADLLEARYGHLRRDLLSA